MDYVDYMIELEKFFAKNHPNPETRTIEDYLEAIAAVPQPFRETNKSLMAAKLLRNDGNLLFSMGKYRDAALLYTNSLRNATPYSTCSALAYANRSAALYHLGAFKECITDIDRALNLPYPKHLRPKIITRKEAAVAKLHNGSNPKESKKGTAAEHLEFAHGENAKLPGVSLGIKIAGSLQKRRGLVAKMPFQPGDVLLVEKPHFTVPASDADNTFCHHCLKTSVCLIPCDRCCIGIYCSEECRAEAHQNYHRIECNILHIPMFPKSFNGETLFLSLRCLNILTEQGVNLEALYNDFEEMEKNQDSEQLVLTEEQFIEDKGKMILSLKTNKLKQPFPRDLFEVAYTVVLLRNHTDFFGTAADVLRLAKLLVKVNNICAFNCFPITFSSTKDPKALGVFPLISLANHACSNNTIAYIDNNDRIVIRASQCIKPGEQICYNLSDTTLSVHQIKDSFRSILQCERYCEKCDEIFLFPIQRQPRIEIDKSLRCKLLKNSHDIESLWKLLELLYVKEVQYPIQVQILKIFLIEAYERRIDDANGHRRLQMLGIL